MNNVVWLSTAKDTPARGYWDQQLLEDLFIKKTHYEKIGSLKEAIVVIPTPYQDEQKVNKQLAKLDKCTVICTSDEENKFDLAKLTHPNIKLYATYPHETEADVTWLPIGYTPHSKTNWYKEKDLDIVFSGQINHDSRQAMLSELGGQDGVVINKSGGFAQGLEPKEYIEVTQRSKVIPAPRGNISPDSFRLYEALEHGALPVAENKQFFDSIFGDVPFPVIEVKKQWSGYCQDGVDNFPAAQNRASAWWQRYKCDLYNELNDVDEVSVVIPVSPIKSHPDTGILHETIQSVRYHTDAQIFLTFDGVREEQEDRRDDYELFINNVLSSGYDRIYPIVFDEHQHQTGMMREVLNHIKTPLILYVEQDTPLVTDENIDWQLVKNLLLDGHSDLVRFHFETVIPEPHKHMMLGQPRKGFLKTIQWSQRPHLTTTAYYRRIMNTCFSENAKSFIEDRMHSVAQEAYNIDGPLGWQQHRLHIYHPEGSIKRSYHTDGREGESKWDDRQVF